MGHRTEVWSGLRVDPGGTSHEHHQKPSCTLVPPCAWCWARSRPRPGDLLGGNTSLAKGKESTLTKHLEGPGPEPALQISSAHTMSLTWKIIPILQNRSWGSERSIICPGVPVKLALKCRSSDLRISFKSTKLPQRCQFLSHLSYL